MPDASVVVARPADPAALVLLFHGVGASAADLVPLGEAIAQARPDAWVVSVEAPHPSGLGSGREWFSVLGVTEQNRPDRIAQAMPLFQDVVARWQAASGVDAAHTVLAGFSQGAIMALESTQAPAPPAGQVIALAGRFAQPVRRAPQGLRLHLVHGDQDGVVPTRHSMDAAAQLRAAGGDVTLDIVPGLGHGIDGRALQLVLQRLGSAPG